MVLSSKVNLSVRKPRNWRRWLTLAGLAVLVASAVVAAHWTALGAKALCIDDVEYLSDNPLVQNPSWDSARRFLTEVGDPSSVKGYYQPLNMISLMLDCAMGGSPENLTPFHRTSLILHAANTLLVMGLLYLLFGNAWAAAAAALLFGVHPMTVETIPWIGERKTLLAAFFALGSLIFYVQYARKGGWRAGGWTRWLWLLASATAYLLAVMSKPTAVPLPFAMLLLDFWPLDRLFRKPTSRRGGSPPMPSGRPGLRWPDRHVFLEKIPFFAIAVASAVVTYISQSKLSAEGRSPLDALYIFCHNVVFYPYKMLWPASLSSHYPYPAPLTIWHPAVLAGVIGTAVLFAALAVSLIWTRAAATGWAIFLVLIFPVMGLIGFSNAIASDKYAYLPVVGLLIVLAYFVGRLWDWRWGGEKGASPAKGPPSLVRVASPGDSCEAASGSHAGTRHVVRATILSAVLVIACGEAFLTRIYLVDWQDTVRLYRHMLAYTPEDPILNNNYGRFVELRGIDLMEKARKEQSAAKTASARGKADEANALLAGARGDANEALGCFRVARFHFEEAVRRSVPPELREPNMPLEQAARLTGYDDALVNLGKAVFMDALRARELADEQAAGDPAKAHLVQAAERNAEKALAEAEWLFVRAWEVSQGRDYAAASNIATIALRSRRDANASIEWSRKALSANPYYAEALLTLAAALEVRGERGDLAEARKALTQARRFRPSDRRIAEELAQFNARHP